MPETPTKLSALTRRSQILRLRAAAREALARYGIEPEALHLLQHFDNTTFSVIDRDGARYVLHIRRPDNPAAPLGRLVRRMESELWWLERIGEELDMPVPRVVHATDGAAIVAITVEGEERYCRLYRWVDGRFLARGLRPVHLEQVGGLTAQLHEFSSRLTVPDWFDRPRVDRADAMEQERASGIVAKRHSPEGGEIVAAVLRRAQALQGALGDGPDVFGVVHADIHRFNYLVADGEVRLIDFDDSGWGHYLYDPAVTFSLLEDLPQYEALRRAYLAGYRQVRALSPEHEAAIQTFIMLREAQDVTSFLEEADNANFDTWVARTDASIERLRQWLDTDHA